MKTEVHIVAVGARTPLGLDAASSCAAVRAGISQINEHPFIIDRTAEPVRMACDTALDPGVIGPERLIDMAKSALKEICEKLIPYTPHLNNIPLLLCLPEERPGWTKNSAQKVKEGLARISLPLSFRPPQDFAQGHAAGLMALKTACNAIRAKEAEFCVILGVDSYLNLDTLGWLDENRQLATAYHRGAFFPGEGAGAFAVASDAWVRRVEIDSLAVIGGIGVAKESLLIKTESICLGEGLTACLRAALKPLDFPEDAVDGIICDINGERYRSEEWGFAILRLPHAFVDPTGYDLPASCWGDVGAASGPLFVMLAVAAGKKGWAKGPCYVIWNGSECGDRAAAVLKLSPQLQGVD